MSKNFQNQNINAAKVIGIQFSILSPDEIRKASVVNVTSRETYVNNKPVINGLFDPRMGVLEPGLICPTDGKDYMQTPGYFGHIELARPVFYIQHIGVIQKILRCVCFKCSKMLINKQKYSQALRRPPQTRLKYVLELCKKVKRCGDDTENGCGCLQPKTIGKEGMASLYAEWVNANNADDDGGKIRIPLTAEMVLKITKRISDEDVTFLGFSPIWSRPDWMICQVLAVPPPSVRPSVKHDAQQRSEDDLTHILVHIIKTNKTLLEKIENNAPEKVINDWTMVLQYHIASQIDNKIPGTSPIAQRSGRPFKSIKDRLHGKGGRMRGNLMAKRVDFSARSVITADPNISIRELGIPLKIAKNITKPVRVNTRNRNFLTKLVQNGPDTWPGAKILERKNGENITLRYLDRKSLVLEEGDIVHRQMMDGDVILFNRQPTLHRMSMMCHIARIMQRGDTFRMNVADTKPYNADFDGDEMNLHMPQDVEAESELYNLAAVPYQIISPGNNAPIIGIYQDSMLGAYQFTREHIEFSQKDAMNMLMMFKQINVGRIRDKAPGQKITNFEILSQIMPPMTLREKNKQFNAETDDFKTSNKIVEINNGEFVRGQIDKGILGAGSRGIIHRICNNFGNMAASDFIDNFQHIVTDYMRQSAFSVGISDLITDDKTKANITTIITEKKTEVNDFVQQVQMGVFENISGKSTETEFETRVSNILGKAQNAAGREALNSLDKNNRFVTMFNAGSKGSELNIQQMTACLGQQNVDGKRIGYGFDNRTLPHYTKYDDSAIARGFVESSYIGGLSPQELFFHAMGGRVGLIDTAVKTSTTGYIQRRLIKGLEDIKVHYDMTLRNSKNKLIQFSYGEDSIDTVKVENQDFPIADMSTQDVYARFAIPEGGKYKSMHGMFTTPTLTRLKKQDAEYKRKSEFYANMILDNRSDIIRYIFGQKSEHIVRSPVAFAHIIKNIMGQQNINANSMVDITLMEAYEIIERAYGLLDKIYYAPPTLLFKILFYYYLSPKDLLIVKRFNKKALEILVETVILDYKRSIVSPGDMVGMIAAQSIGEPTTQMTLNTFHFAGVALKSNVSRGVPRIEEILALSANIKNPSLTIRLHAEDETDREKANAIQYMIEYTKLRELVKNIDICFDPDDLNTLIGEDESTMTQYSEFEKMMNTCAGTDTREESGDDKGNNNDKKSGRVESKWILRMELDPETMLEKNITMDDIEFVLNNIYSDDISCVYSDYNSDKLVFRIRMSRIVKSAARRNTKTSGPNSLDQSDQIYILKNFQDQLLNNVVLRGVKQIEKVILRKVKDILAEKGGTFVKQEIWVLDTVGANLLDVLGLDFIDANKTVSNDIMEIYNVLGIDAMRQSIYDELIEVLEFDSAYVNTHHMSLLVDRMTFGLTPTSLFRHKINIDDIGPIAKASFEETPEMFLRAARHAELDPMCGISANVMCGQEGMFGTAAFQVVLDMSEMSKLEEKYKYEYKDNADIIEAALFDTSTTNVQDICSSENLTVTTNISHVKHEDLGHDDIEYNPFA